MRIFLASAAAAAFAFAATPAFAQYGGSPQEQVDGAPTDQDMTAPQDDDDSVAVAPDDEFVPDMMPQDDAGYADDDGKPGGEDYAAYGGAYPDDAEQAGPGDAYEGVDAAEDDGADVDEQAEPGDDVQGDTWQGEDGRTYCRRSDGTTGLIVGGGAGALIGNGIDGGRRRGAGTIIGGIIGAVVGTAIERNANEQRCR